MLGPPLQNVVLGLAWDAGCVVDRGTISLV